MTQIIISYETINFEQPKTLAFLRHSIFSDETDIRTDLL